MIRTYNQLAVPFKIYADFESILKLIKRNNRNKNSSYTEKYQDHVPSSFAYKVVCIVDRFSKTVVLYRRQNAVIKFIVVIFKEYVYCQKVIKKHFNKNLIFSE